MKALVVWWVNCDNFVGLILRNEEYSKEEQLKRFLDNGKYWGKREDYFVTETDIEIHE